MSEAPGPPPAAPATPVTSGAPETPAAPAAARTAMRANASGGWRGTLAAAMAFAALTCWFTFPQAARWTSVPLHHDSFFSIWRLSWIAHQLPRAPLHLFDANVFVPSTGTFAFSDAVLLQGLLASPLLWLGLPGVLVYNIIVFTSFVFAGVGMFVLVRALTGSAAAAFVAGMVFAFAPFRIDHYYHLELLWSGWMPLTMWAFHQVVATGERRWGVATGLLLAAQVLSCIYYAVFLATLLALATIVLLATRTLRVAMPAFRHLAAGALVCGLVAAPYILPYARNARVVGTRTVDETTRYSAEWRDYGASPHQNLLYGRTEAGNEKQLFPGLTAIALALVALWPPVSRVRLLYAAGVLFAADLSLGFHGIAFRLLYAVVPFYHGLRVPARAGMLTLALLAPLAGVGAARLLAAIADAGARPRRGAGSRGLALAASVALCGLLVVEYSNEPLALTRLPTRQTPLAEWLARQPPVVIAELPMPRADALPGNEAQYQFVSTFHWQRLVNGYSGTYPPSYFRLLEQMAHFPSDRAIAELRARQVRFIVVHPNLFRDADVNTLLLRLVSRQDVRFVGEMPDGFSVVSVYELLPAAR